MNTKMYETVRNVTNTVTNWLKKHSFTLVLIMSLFHVGLAYIHTRDSGRADPPLILPEAFCWAGERLRPHPLEVLVRF